MRKFFCLGLTALLFAGCEPITLKSVITTQVSDYIKQQGGGTISTGVGDTIPANNAAIGTTQPFVLKVELLGTITGADDASHWVLSGTAVAGIQITAVATDPDYVPRFGNTDSARWVATTTGALTDGDATLTFQGVTKSDGSPVQLSLHFTVDSTPPPAITLVSTEANSSTGLKLNLQVPADPTQVAHAFLDFTPAVAGFPQEISPSGTQLFISNLSRETTYTITITTVNALENETVTTSSGTTQPSVEEVTGATTEPVSMAMDAAGVLYLGEGNVPAQHVPAIWPYFPNVILSGTTYGPDSNIIYNTVGTPYSVAVRSDGYVMYDADPASAQINRWDYDVITAHKFVASSVSGWPYALTAGTVPRGMVMDGSGDLYVGDNQTGAGNILKVTVSGPSSYKVLATDGQVQPFAMASDPNGDLIVLDQTHSKIFRVTPGSGAAQGTVSTVIDLASAIDAFVMPWGLAVNSQGRIFFSDRNSSSQPNIYAVGSDGTGLKVIVAGANTSSNGPASDARVSNPGAMLIDHDGNLLFIDGPPTQSKLRRVDF